MTASSIPDVASPVRRRPLALSLGDPAGIGPEIIAKAWSALRHDGPAFVVVGDRDLMAAAMPARMLGAVRRVSSPAEALEVFASALPGAVSGLVTAPIAKAPLYAAGFPFPGHTEFLAELTAGAPLEGCRGPVMMLAAGGLRAALVTIHQPLREAIAALDEDSVVRVGRVTSEALVRDFGVARPRLVLAGLNPHAGEGGTLGRDEIDFLNPAAARLRALGVDCTDARPADSLFHAEARAGYDAAICLYHDQALIPVKTIDFWGGVNATLGLPIVRTSPDHGVAYNIAGRGLARPDSLIAAIRMASDMAARRGP